MIALDPNFRKLSVEHIVSAYKRTKNRAILLDYDGAMMLPGSIINTPNTEAVGILNNLCNDPRNVVFLVSRKDRRNFTKWFSSCAKLGIAAEHGYFVRYVVVIAPTPPCFPIKGLYACARVPFEYKP